MRYSGRTGKQCPKVLLPIKWIKNVSTKIRPLTHNTEFHTVGDALIVFNLLKCDIENSVVCSMDESIPYQAEADSFEFAIAASLSQNNRPVAFCSRMHNGSDLDIPL